MFAVMVVDDDPKIREWFEVEIEWERWDLILSVQPRMELTRSTN